MPEESEMADAFAKAFDQGAFAPGSPASDQPVIPPAEDAPDFDAVDDDTLPSDGVDGEVDDTEDDDTEPSGSDTPQSVRVGDKEVSLEELTGLLELRDLITSDLKFQQHLTRYFEPAPVATAPTEPAPADDNNPFKGIPDEYLQDPVFKAIYDMNIKLYEQVQSQTEAVTRLNGEVSSRQAAENEGIINAAAGKFAEDYKLDESQLRDLRVKAAKLEVIPALLRETGNLTAATTRALELAYWADPQYRERNLETELAEQQAVKKKRAKAGAVSGSAGSAARTTPAPKNEQERREAMINEIAAKGNW